MGAGGSRTEVTALSACEDNEVCGPSARQERLRLFRRPGPARLDSILAALEGEVYLSNIPPDSLRHA